MTLQVSPQTKQVFHLSLPIFAELLLQLLVGNMDQFMISHFGSAAVAAIGNGNQHRRHHSPDPAHRRRPGR